MEIDMKQIYDKLVRVTKILDEATQKIRLLEVNACISTAPKFEQDFLLKIIADKKKASADITKEE